MMHSIGGGVHRQFVMIEVYFGWWWVDTLLEWNRDRTVRTNVSTWNMSSSNPGGEEFMSLRAIFSYGKEASIICNSAVKLP